MRNRWFAGIVMGALASATVSGCSKEEAAAPPPAPAKVEAPAPAPAAAPPAVEAAPAPAAAAAGQAPREEWIIWADGDPWDGEVPLEVTFECELMEEVASAKFEWDFGDGSPLVSEANPKHTYTQAGRFTARCLVTDPSGGRGEDSVIIDVDPIGGAPGAAAPAAPAAPAPAQ